MEKIEITSPEPKKAIPVLQDAIERQKRILAQSISRTEERVQRLAAELGVNIELLTAGGVPHPEDNDMDLLDLEGEVGILRHLREQLDVP